jgi:hypothetical protein
MATGLSRWICTPGKKGEAAVFSPSLVIPGAKIYKARWVK